MSDFLSKLERLEQLRLEIEAINVAGENSAQAEIFKEAFRLLRECLNEFMLMKPLETANLFRVSLRTVWNWIATGLIPRHCLHQIGATIRINRLGVLRASVKTETSSKES